MYAILFADQPGVYVRLSSTTNSLNGDVKQPVHGAQIWLDVPPGAPEPTGFSDEIDGTVSLTETYTVTSGDTDYYYYAPVSVSSGLTYGVTAYKPGFDTASAYVTVPQSFVTIPDINTYTTLRFPDSTNFNPSFNVNLGGSAAYFVRLAIEYRGFDGDGNFHSGFVFAAGDSQPNPFIQVTSSQVSYTVNRLSYASQLSYAEQLTGSLRLKHLYADIILTQISDPLYRFYLTSGRWANPLAMRTDRIVFSNITNGDGIVGAAAVDTTRIFLF